MRARGLTVPLLCSLAIVVGAPAALAGGTSLYSGPGPRPGPDVLYGGPIGRAPGGLFLPVPPGGAGMAGDLVAAATGQPVGGPAPLVALDTGRRQIEVRVPHAAWTPGGGVARLAAGVGLWDTANGRY